MWTLGAGVRVTAVERNGNRWVVSAAALEVGSCPRCGALSKRKHGRYLRHFQDLLAQGAIVGVKLLKTRWRCRMRTPPTTDALGALVKCFALIRSQPRSN